MKRAIFAVIASMFVFSAAYAAGDAPAGAEKAATLSEADCKAAWDKCTDQACKDKLVADSGCKAEETK